MTDATTKNFDIRIANTSDASAVSSVLAASYPASMADHYDPIVLSELMPRMIVANPRLLASGRYYLAVSQDSAVVGCGGWSEQRPGTGEIVGGLAHIRHFGVHLDWAGSGIGKAIFARCLAIAREERMSEFECFSSLNGEGFYRALGFEAVRPIEVPMGSGPSLPAILMRRAMERSNT